MALKKIKIFLIVLCLLFVFTGIASATGVDTVEIAKKRGVLFGADEALNGKPLMTDTQLEQYITNKYPSYTGNDNLRYAFKEGYFYGYGEKGGFQGSDLDSFAETAGKTQGEMQASIDYIDGLPAKWDRSVLKFSEVVEGYGLTRLTKAQQEAFYAKFKEAYEKSYNDKYLGLMKKSGSWMGDGEAAGKKAGYDLAKENAVKAKQAGMAPNPNVPMTDGQIIAKYNIYNAGSEYQKLFLIAFKLAYQDTYMREYNKTKPLDIEDKLTQYEKEIQEKAPAWYSKGNSSGSTEGALAGKKDVEEGLIKNWRRKRPSDSSIISKYGLNKAGYNETRAFLLGYDKGFEKAYESAFLDNLTDLTNAPRDKGIGDGESAGKTYGGIRARADFQSGKNQDNSVKISDSEIISRYNLSKTDSDYREGFIEGFKKAYKESYDNEFTAAMSEDASTKMSQGAEAGQIAGSELGEKDATADMMKGVAYDPEKNKPTESFLIKRYNLDKQNIVYKEDFIRAAMEAYVISYDEAYKGMSMEETDNKTISEMIELAGGVITTDDGRMKVEVPGGVFYDRTLMSIETLNSSYLTNYGFVEASKPYKVSILNPNGNFDDTRKITISFEYYGKPKNNIGETEAGLPGNAFNAGIYKLEGNQWKYMDSKIVGDTVVVEVNPLTLTNDGNIFALILDKSYSYLHDIRGHWAKDEINAMVRRAVITGYPDKTFRPDQPITRGEFLVLLSRHYNWNLSSTMGYGTRFTDHANFGFYATYVDYGSSNGYVIGYPDGEFKAHRNISYREIDWIMQRITKRPEFTWETYAKMMVNEKGVRPKSYSDYDAKITRAEFAYMVYMMDKWKY